MILCSKNHSSHHELLRIDSRSFVPGCWLNRCCEEFRGGSSIVIAEPGIGQGRLWFQFHYAPMVKFGQQMANESGDPVISCSEAE
jgi:hypothetical protein